MPEYYSPKIIGKVILTAKLVTTSPFLIGGGTNDDTDINVVRLPDDRPYIPASSLVGVLKNLFKSQIKLANTDVELVRAFWGTKQSEIEQGDQLYQSHIIVDDLMPVDADKNKVKERDGIKIDHKNGVTINKYDYEIVEAGCSFQFRLESTIRSGMNVDKIKEWIYFIEFILRSDEISFGAMTNYGFGKFDCKDFYSYHFDFEKNKKAADQWFVYLSTNQLPKEQIIISNYISRLRQDTFFIEANFKLKTSLITGTYGVKSGEPDKVQLTSNGKAVLSGKSIKGAIRHRALKILTTKKNNSAAEKEIYDMFGWVDENEGWKDEKGEIKKATKSRLSVEEAILNDVIKQQQPRIRINRFEGGASESALYNSEPIWKNGDAGFSIKLKLEVKEGKEWEIGLLLHLLKDLWTSDLAIGGEKNVGRGTLIGVSANIKYQQKEVSISEIKGVLEISDKALLNEWANSLNELKSEDIK